MQFLLADEYATDRLEEAADLTCQVLRGAGEGDADRMVVVADRLSDLGEADPLPGSTRGCSQDERLSFSISLGGLALFLGRLKLVQARSWSVAEKFSSCTSAVRQKFQKLQF
jgi:hypothetical protein